MAVAALLAFSMARSYDRRRGPEIRPLLPRIDCSSLAGDSCAMELPKAFAPILGAAARCDDLAPRISRVRERAREMVANVATDDDDREESLERLGNGETLWRGRYLASLGPEACSEIRARVARTEKRVWLP